MHLVLYVCIPKPYRMRFRIYVQEISYKNKKLRNLKLASRGLCQTHIMLMCINDKMYMRIAAGKWFMNISHKKLSNPIKVQVCRAHVIWKLPNSENEQWIVIYIKKVCTNQYKSWPSETQIFNVFNMKLSKSTNGLSV